MRSVIKKHKDWYRGFFLMVSLFAVSELHSEGAPYSDNPSGYAVASAHPLATNAGLAILARGGNAFDAAVAVSAVLAVVEPYHSGLGGGGYWLLHQARTKKNIFIDGRETSPMAASRDMYLDSEGKTIPNLSLNGGLAAAIPGEPAALAFIASHYGRLPLAQTLAPAIDIAEHGFLVDHQFNYWSALSDRLEQLQKYPATAAVFLRQGRPYRIGERLIQRDLAKTLRTLAASGHDGFYRGEVASRLVAAVNRAGGLWTSQDLAAYQIKVREPLQGVFRDVHVVTAPPPSAGGVALLTMLNILSDYPLDSFSKAQSVHYIVEAMRLAFWQRAEFLADPDFIKIPLAHLLSASNAADLRQKIDPNHATESASLPNKAMDKGDHDTTTHFSIMDKEGNRVSATLTVNYIFGSSVVADGTGVLLNDEMDDFSTNPKEKNVFGLFGGVKNTIEPGKRPLSSMTPTFLETPGRVAILGTPGGSRIPTMVLLGTLAFSHSYGAISMVSDMRFHHQYLPDLLQFEPDTFSPTLQKDLKRMGYHLDPLRQYYGDMQAITWDRERNIVTAAADPRHIGLSAVVGDPSGGYGVKH